MYQKNNVTHKLTGDGCKKKGWVITTALEGHCRAGHIVRLENKN
jgi:hypothetical protein